jgi:arsenate reductase
MFRVLLLSRTNAVLSPMAEGYFRKFAGDLVEIYCAGIVNDRIDPVVLSVLEEDGVDTATIKQHQLSEFKHIDFDYVLTFDEESTAESHHLPSKPVKYHFDFYKLIPEELPKENKQEVFRNVRDKMKKGMRSFVREHFTDPKTK